MLNNIEHLTIEQMAKKYPDTWLGINNIKYDPDDKVSIRSADVVYTDKSREEILRLHIEEGEHIYDWYTNCDSAPFGMLSIIG